MDIYRPKINHFHLWRDERNQSTTKALAAAGTAYSNEIFASSDRGYATLALQVIGVGTCALTIKIQYKLPMLSTWTTAVTIASVSPGANTVAYAYRLDGILGLNWFPNLPLRYQILETGGGTAILQGVHTI